MIKPRLKPRRVIGNIAEYFEIKNNYGAISELGKSIKKDQTYFYAQMRIGLLHVLSTLIEKGSHVCTTSYTIYEINNIIRASGNIPVMVDINMDSLGPDIQMLKHAAISTNAKAIIYTHLHGYRSNIESLYQFCTRNGILLIEDCAQSLWLRDWLDNTDLTLPGQSCDIALFSSGFFKSINTIAGGILMIKKDSEYCKSLDNSYSKLKRKITKDYLIRSLYGVFFAIITNKYVFNTVTFPILKLGSCKNIEAINKRAREENNPSFTPRSLKDCLKASRLQTLLMKLKTSNAITVDFMRKKELKYCYLQNLRALMKSGKCLIPGIVAIDNEYVLNDITCLNQIPLQAHNSNELIKFLIANNIDIAKQHIKNLSDSFPEGSIIYSEALNARKTSKDLILLPCYPELKIYDIQRICKLINNFYHFNND